MIIEAEGARLEEIIQTTEKCMYMQPEGIDIDVTAK